MASPQRHKILVLDDHSSVAEAVAYALGLMEPEFDTAPQSVRSKVAAQVAAEKPDIVITNWICGPNGSRALIKACKSVSPETRWILFAATPLPYVLREALEAGVTGIVSKGSNLTELATATNTVLNGLRHYCDETRTVMARMHRDAPIELTDTEVEVLQCIVDGLESQGIAERLTLTSGTVHNYLSSLRLKTKQQTMVELGRYAVERGIAAPWNLYRG